MAVAFVFIAYSAIKILLTKERSSMKKQRGYMDGLAGTFTALLIVAAICGYGVIRGVEWVFSKISVEVTIK